MPVYMIRAGHTGPVKIGHSNDPGGRLTEFQVAHYEKLRLIRVFEGGEAEEAMLHARFADVHIRGEWHSFSRLMLTDLGLTEIDHAKLSLVRPELEETEISLEEILLTLGGDGAVARALNCGQPAISNWKKRGTIPPLRQIQIAELARTLPLAHPITLDEIRHASRIIEDARSETA
jgi:hypothetical protein